MKLIKPSFEIKEQEHTLDGVYRHIEWAGRHCYKSEDKITPDSAKSFVDRMIKSDHGTMLEHGTIYLNLHWDGYEEFNDMFDFYNSNPYSKVVKKLINMEDLCPDLFIVTNFRVITENNRFNDLKYLCEPIEYHEKRATVKFILDRGISHEFVRHRKFSFAQESTRYCNYSKNRFNNELTFIIPSWVNSQALQEVKGTVINHDEYGSLIAEYYYHLTGKGDFGFKPWEITPEMNFIANLQISEQLYLELLNQGWQPQQARAVLPNSLKTELIMTGFVSDWEHFFKLRCAKSAHPDARALAIPLQEEFKKLNLI